MTSKLRWLVALVAAFSAAVLVTPLPAGAHNAGHLFLPDGTCLVVGSLKEAPGDLDLIPATPDPPFDEYGTSFAAFQGRTPLLPGPCPG